MIRDAAAIDAARRILTAVCQHVPTETEVQLAASIIREADRPVELPTGWPGIHDACRFGCALSKICAPGTGCYLERSRLDVRGQYVDTRA